MADAQEEEMLRQQIAAMQHYHQAAAQRVRRCPALLAAISCVNPRAAPFPRKVVVAVDQTCVRHGRRQHTDRERVRS